MLLELIWRSASQYLLGLPVVMRPQWAAVLATPTTVTVAQQTSSSDLPGEPSYVVPAAFPTSVYSSYYIQPGPTNEPQPALFDPILNKTFPLNLTDSTTVPTYDNDPVYFPHALANLSDASAEAVIDLARREIKEILNSNRSGLSSNCSKCIAALIVGQMAAKLAPAHLPDAMMSLCQSTNFKSNSTCQQTYEAGSYGAVWTQVLASADVAGLDGQLICNSLSSSFCAAPGVTPYKAKFPKEKPDKVTAPAPSGERVKVLHLSDLHLDPRYEVGSEGNCTSGLCCRHAAALPNGSTDGIGMPAPLYGYFKCDSPYYLALAAIQSIGPLTGTNFTNHPAFTLYTGDLVSHDSQNQLSEAYVENVELSVWTIFKNYIGGPIYAALGNHDSSPANQDSPNAIDGNQTLGQQFSWNYDHVSALWERYGWIDAPAAAEARTHYAAYSVVHPLGLRIITINTDFYYKGNYYAFLQAADPDYSGMFSFLIEELQKAEDAGQRAWIAGHVLSGWDGSNPLPNGSDLLYQIIERYSPHVVAGVFFGHTHEDQAFIYYANNGTNQTAENVVSNAWVGPSITPLTNVNSGFRMYEVDTGNWDVYDAYTFYSDVSRFSEIDPSHNGPEFRFEYSTRDVYGEAAGWPDDAPLNGTFWHRVTEVMEANKTFVSVFNTFQGKSSIHSPNCTSDVCAEAKVCYIRSGSVALGRQCPQGFASVQSTYTGTNF